MSQIPFVKYQGAGNDFIIIDQINTTVRAENWPVEKINRICDRRFGIGADGLMLLCTHAVYDFEMIYYNSDGNISSMCGNGGRCIAAHAYYLGLADRNMSFLAIDGPHLAKVVRPNWVELEMKDVSTVKSILNGHWLDTGSPHYVEEVADIAAIDVFEQGSAYRNNSCFAPGGTNVNFISGDINGLHIATYERGVEAETLACGTGVTAAALVAVLKHGQEGVFELPVSAKGGKLSVRGKYSDNTFSDIWLCGPTEFVFEGTIEIR